MRIQERLLKGINARLLKPDTSSEPERLQYPVFINMSASARNETELSPHMYTGLQAGLNLSLNLKRLL